MYICENGIKWDYGPDDLIDYFDFNKSYYITKYRPINDTMGLDFNPEPFSETGRIKQTTGKYSGAIFGSRMHKNFWDEQKNRCEKGYEANGYRVTPGHYFFLNFYNLKTSATDEVNQSFGFPSFLVFQYEYFHYIEMCDILKKDIAVLKSRGIGFSEIAASEAARTYTFIPNYRTVITAYSKGHLDPTIEKMWFQLDWLNENTEGAFRRVRMVKNTAYHKRASIKSKDLSESGHRAEIVGIIVDEPDKLRGDRIQKLIFEEAGADPVLLKKWVKGDALISVLGGKRVGTILAFGTGGSSKAGSMEGIKTLITTPEGYNMLPVRHNYTVDNSYRITGMFIPAYKIVYELIDNRGYCNRDAAIAWYNKVRASKASSPKDLIDYQAEYCFTIEEALIQKEDNMFPREELAEQLTQLTIYKTVDLPQRGFLVWDINKQGEKTGIVNWREDPKGNIQISEHPLLGEGGDGFHNLYVGGIDSIDIGMADSATTDSTKLSEFCVMVKRRRHGLLDPAYVAMYKDRPRDPREAYENAAKLLTYYNAKAVLESTRTAILTYFRDKKYINLLMKRPRSTLSDITRSNSNIYGAPATEKVINHGRELVYEFCLEFSWTIRFREMLEQLLNYSDERKKEFDVVAALQMTELADEEISLRKPREREDLNKKFIDVGYWTDANGYKHFGPIPQTEEEKYGRARIREEDSWLYQKSL